MRNQLLLLISFSLALLCAAPASAADRAWQQGKVLSVEKTSEFQGTTYNTNASGEAKDTRRGTKYEDHSTTTATDNHDNFMVYVIAEGDKLYTAKQRLLFPWSKHANLTVGDSLKFAIEKGKLYMLDDDGKEFSAKIIKKELKDTQ